MYQLAGTSTVAGALLAREVLPEVAGNGAAVQAAQTALAFTGIAAGVYVAVAVSLILIGLVLRHWGTAATADQA
jgi:hypothetical protein